MHSFYDKNGKLFVDCTECLRGHNGEKSCSAGWLHLKPGAGCFMGELLPNLIPDESTVYGNDCRDGRCEM